MRGRRLGGALELLDELPGDAEEMRACAVRALSALALGDGICALGFTAATLDVRHPIRWHSASGATQELVARAMDPRTAAYAFKLTDLRLARPIERRSFRSIGQLGDRGAILESETWQHLYAPARVTDQVRLVVTRGDEVIGFVALVRATGAPVFDAADRRILQRWVQPLRRALVAADALERDGRPDGPADFVLNPGGRVLFASVEGRAWLEKPSFRDYLTGLVRVADRQPAASSTIVGREHIDLIRVHDGSRGVRYLAHVVPARPLLLAPAARLTTVQREVASMVAAGATTREVAAMSNRSIETVRSHIKAIYIRLGVASRAELASALRASP